MRKSSIVVVGSSNTDMVVLADHLPGAGETVLGGKFFMNPGGKGANQAVAAARLGGAVTFIAKTGDDIFGKQSLELLKGEGIDTSHILTDKENPSGVALITVNKDGENCIVVASGSNAALTVADLSTLKEIIQQADIVLLQLEIPVSTVEYVAAVAAEAKVKVILNPAPAAVLSDHLLRQVSIITPNETEAEMLTGISIIDQETAILAAKKLKDKGVHTVIITMGAQGALLLQDDLCVMVPTSVVKAIDTTAAGDVFNGALAVALSKNISIRNAVDFACKSAAISVTRLGAQASAPYKHEVV
ncbi:MAG: ribokinase [Bacteroidetes bacterium]|nr:ribokinase [Bacteroidota bacterium]